MQLKLYRPVLSNKVTQKFGDSRACVYPSGKIVNKRADGSCPAGSRSFYESIGMKAHNGIDMSTWHGEPVFHCATYEGVMKIEKDRAGGIGVDVISKEPVTVTFWHGSRKEVYNGHVKCRYWHLKAPVGYDGKVVKLGETIGLADNTGASSGDHLHFGIKKCDAQGRSTEPGNGYTGAFDPTPFMDMTTDAKSAAEFLFTKAPVLSEQERKEMLSQLSLLSQLLNSLLELKRRL